MRIAGSLWSLLAMRRAHRLARVLAETIPRSARSVLEVGCREGTLSALVQRRRPALTFRGLEAAPPLRSRIPVEPYDGAHLPYLDHSFDVVMFVDRLAHAPDPTVLLREARRVARLGVVLKDQVRTLGAAEWGRALRATGLAARSWHDCPSLYPAPACWVFERGQPFVAWLGRATPERSPLA